MSSPTDTQNDSSTVRQVIINKASQLFYKNGYNNTAIADILAAAQVSETTLSKHFE